jgi:hypothetical protein
MKKLVNFFRGLFALPILGIEKVLYIIADALSLLSDAILGIVRDDNDDSP